MIEECLAVEFDVTGDDCPLAAATEETDTEIVCEPPQLRSDGNALLRFTAPPDDDLAATLDADDRIRYLHRSRGGDRDTYRCLSKSPCVVHRLTDAGFMAETLVYRDGEERHTGAVVGNDVLQGVMSAAGDAVGVWGLTSAQAEALRAAFEMGYFAVPKGATADEVASAVGISKSAFLERLRRGQAAMFERVFA